MKVYSHRKVATAFVAYAFLGTMMLFILSPIAWTVVTSFQPPSNLMVAPPRIKLSQMNLRFYQQLINDSQFRKALINSLIVIITSTIIGLSFAALGAYSVARYRFKGKNAFLFILFSIQLAPALALLIPLFVIMRGLGLIDTYPGLILTFLLFQVPVAIWLLRGFFNSIPAELYDAAMIDGCSRLAVFFKIALPLAAPGLGATAIYMFIGGWNDLLIPLTVSIYRRSMLTVYASSFGGLYNINYGGATAVAVLSGLPTILLAIVFRKFLVRGLMAGAVKG